MAEFQPRDRAEVTSGSLKGQEVFVLTASSSLVGFYDCVYHKPTGVGHQRKEVTLAGSQEMEVPMPRITNALHLSTLVGLVDGAHWVQLAAISHQQTELVGSATILDAETEAPLLCDVFVHTLMRRAGVGTELVRAATRWADAHDKSGLYLHVKPENQAARALYEQEGFQYTGEVKDDGSLWMLRPWGDGHVLLGKEVVSG